MKVLSDILHKAGILKEAAEAYSSGGYSVLVRNTTTQKLETVPSTSLLPIQTGNAGKFLTTNGTVTSWSSVPAATLQAVTDAGNTTTNSITAANFYTGGLIVASGAVYSNVGFYSNNNGNLRYTFDGNDLVMRAGTSTSNEYVRIFGATGNVSIGNIVDAGYKLDTTGFFRLGPSAGHYIGIDSNYIYKTLVSNTLYTQDSENIVMQANNTGYIAFATQIINRLVINNSGTVTVTSLAGTGSRMVVADSSGVLSTQAFTTGTVTSVGLSSSTSGVTITGSPITSTGSLNFEIATASGSQNGLLSSSDWTTFNNKQVAGNYITALTGEVTASGPGSASATLLNSAVTGKLLTGLNLTGGGTISATDSILQAFGKTQNQISALVGGVMYEGVWNASTNSPAIVSGVGSKGVYYIVNVAGSISIDGINDWKVGDWIIFNGTNWDKVDNTDAVSSVNGFTGAVGLTTANVSEVTNLYYTDARARAAITLTTTGSSGSSTYVGGTLNVPTYTLAGLGGQPTLDGTGYVRMVGTTVSYISGTSSQFLKADGSLDSNTYVTGGPYLPLAGGTLTGALGGTSATFSGDVIINGKLSVGTTYAGFAANIAGTLYVIGGEIFLTDGYAIRNASNNSRISFNTSALDFLGAATFSSSVTATSFVKTGGTSAQFLMADGSVSTNPGWITSYTETDTLATVTARGSSTTGNITINGYTTVAGGADLVLKAAAASSDPGDIVFEDGTGAELHRLWAGTNTLNYRTNGGTTYLMWHSGNLTNLNQLSNGPGYITAAQTYYIGTTQNALNRASAAQTLTGVSIDGDAATVGGLAASAFVRAYTTTADNIDSDWGQSFKTFDPVPSGTPPISSPNLRTINVGENFNRRTQMAFDYAADRAWFRRKYDSSWSSWVEFYHSGNLTNLNQLTNGPGYITGYTETDTLATVTARGASTSTAVTLSSGSNYFNGHHYFIAYDENGNHYPHYNVGSNNNGAKVNIRVYTGNGGTLRLFYLDGQSGAISWDGNTILHAGNYNSYAPTLTGGGASGTWGINITGTATYATNATRLYASDSPYTYGSGSSYYLYMNYDGGSYWELKVSPATPGTVRVAYANSAGNADTVDGYHASAFALVGHTHDLTRYSLAAPGLVDSLTTTNFRTQLFGSTTSGYNLSTARWNTAPSGLSGHNNYGTVIAWSGSDTHGFLSVNYDSAYAKIGGGSADLIQWSKNIAFGDGTGASGTWGISISGNAATATTAGSTAVLTASGALTTQQGSGTVIYSYALTNPQTGLFAASDNANSILTVNRHPGDYYSQLGFSSNGNLYYRNFVNTAINTSQAWQQIWTSTSLTNLNQLTNGPGYITGSYIPTSGGGYGNGNYEFASSDNNSTSYSVAAIELRETDRGSSSSYLAPRLAFHWGNVVASQISIESNGRITVLNNPGTGYEKFAAGAITGYGNIVASGDRPVTLDITNGAIYIQGNSGGWATGTYFKGSAGTTHAGFGALGSADTFSNLWIGAAYNSAWMTFTSSAVNSQVALQQGGNQVLHAANYNSYAPTLTGGGASGSWGIDITGSAAMWGGYYTPTRTNWQSRSAGDLVVGQLSWKYYGNNHTIIDASAGTAPDGTSINNTNSAAAWTGSYPTLVGWNGSQTYGVRVDSARVADTAATATNILNTGTVTLASATESNSIYVTQPSYTSNQPVKLLNFDWYGNVFSMGNIRSSTSVTNGFGFYYTASGGGRVELARFTSGGNLLLNTTTDSGQKLQVNGDMSVTTSSRLSTSSGNVNIGSVPELEPFLSNKLNVGGSAYFNGKIYLNGIGTSGEPHLKIASGTTDGAQIRLFMSTAPTSPVNGDIWFDGTELKMRIGGITKTFTIV